MDLTKIFITIPWFSPAFRAGGPIRSIAHLVKEFHEDVEYCIYCSDTDLNGAALKNIITGEWVDYNDHTRVWYSEPGKISENLVKQVEAIKPDVLYIVGIYSWHFNMVPLIYCKAPKKILSTRGMLHPGALSPHKWKRWIYLKVFTLFEYHHKVCFHARDDEEKKSIIKYFGSPAEIFVAENFPNKLAVLPVHKKERGSLKLVSMGIIDPGANILAVLQALETSAQLIHYDIYWPAGDHDYLRACKQQVKVLPKNISVIWHGEIDPSKVIDALTESHVFILPGVDGDSAYTVHEALSAGRPTITGNNPEWKELEKCSAGLVVSPYDTDGLKNAIDFFADMSQQELDKWSEGAYRYSEKSPDVENIRKKYGGMFDLPARAERINTAGHS